jgi:hypothetical protein
MFSLSRKKTPKEYLFTDFKKQIQRINDENKLASFPGFIGGINTYLRICRTAPSGTLCATSWDESMVSAAFSRYLDKQSEKSVFMAVSQELAHFRMLIPANHEELSKNFNQLCEERKSLLAIDNNFHDLKQLLSSPGSYFQNLIFAADRNQDRRMLIYWLRLLAELSVIQIPGQAVWPNEQDVRTMIFQMTPHNAVHQALFIDFFISERTALAQYLGLGGYNPLSNSFDNAMFAEEAAAARADSPQARPDSPHDRYATLADLPPAYSRSPSPSDKTM